MASRFNRGLLFLAIALTLGARSRYRQELRDVIGCLYRLEVYGQDACWAEVKSHCATISSVLAPSSRDDLVSRCERFNPLEARALRDHLWTTFQVNPRPNLTPDYANGHKLYENHCYGCHGLGGNNGPLSSRFPQSRWYFDNALVRDRVSPAMIHHFVMDGKIESGMPLFRAQLTVDEIWDISHYTMILLTPQAPDGKLIGAVGLGQLSQLSSLELQGQLSRQGVCGFSLQTCEDLAALWRRRGPFNIHLPRTLAP